MSVVFAGVKYELWCTALVVITRKWKLWEFCRV